MSITVSNGTGYIQVDYGTGKIETCKKGSFRTVIKEPYLYLVFNNVDNIFPKYTFGDNHSLMRDKIELLYTDVGTPASASATALRDTILGWDGVELLPTGAATSAKQLPNDHDVTVSNMIPAVETGLATSAKQLADDHNVTVSNMISDVETGLATSDNQTDGSQKTQIINSTGDDVGVHDEMLYTTDSGHLIGEGLIPRHKAWLKIGYNPVVTNVEETLWSAGGTYVWPTAEAGLEVVSSDNAQDIGTQIKTGTSDGGSLTTLVDSGADFTAATAVAVGDCVVLDKSGTTPEWGKVTGVTATTLTFAGGFSSGGVGDARDYIVIDYSAYSGVSAVFIKYLDDTFLGHDEIVILNGTTVVPTVNTDYYRVNSLRVICAGSGGVPVGNISLRNLADTPIYAYITAGYTISRQAIFTVPLGKTLYMNSFNAAWCSPNDSKVQSARVILRANVEPRNAFNMGNIFFPYTEVMVTNENIQIANPVPFKVLAKTDVIVSIISTNAAGEGPATCVMRGWIVTD